MYQIMLTHPWIRSYDLTESTKKGHTLEWIIIQFEYKIIIALTWLELKHNRT